MDTDTFRLVNSFLVMGLNLQQIKVIKIRIILTNKRSFNSLPGVLHGTSNSILPETILKIHLIKGSDAT